MAVEDEQLLLIVRHLNTPEDELLAIAVKNWRAETVANELYFQEIYKLWYAASAGSVLQNIDVEKAVSQLTQKIDPGQPAEHEDAYTPHPRRRWLRWAVGTAAVVAAGLLVYRYTRPEAVRMITLSTHTLKDSVHLSDGSVVYLDTCSTIAYPAKFVADNRQLYFEKGNAFFTVAADSMRPFTVIMGKTAVTVLGTSFNIHKDAAHISVDVKTGRVMFLANDQPRAVLDAGSKAQYSLPEDSITTYSNKNQNSDAWLTGELRFTDEPLSKVFSMLEDHYHVQIDLDTNLSKLGKLNASFVNNSLDEVIALLERTYPISIEKKGTRLIVRNK